MTEGCAYARCATCQPLLGMYILKVTPLQSYCHQLHRRPSAFVLHLSRRPDLPETSSLSPPASTARHKKVLVSLYH